jgi:hypothetical protein
LITAEEALQIAIAECKRRGWDWAIPNLAVLPVGDNWQVATRAKGKGARLVINKQTGEVMSAGWIPR